METEFKCKFCSKLCKNYRSLVNHERLCKNNPNAQKIVEWAHNDNWHKAMANMRGHGGNNQYTKAKRLGLPPPINPMFGKISPNRGKKISEEVKKKISEGRKKWIRENPDKYPWKRKEGRFKSVPCEHLKEILHKEFNFVEEYTDETWEHKYSLDIAFPDNKIAIEVNGTQHYNRDGTLKDYYQKRHNYLESCGWKIMEVYYTHCFVEDKINEIKQFILSVQLI